MVSFRSAEHSKKVLRSNKKLKAMQYITPFMIHHPNNGQMEDSNLQFNLPY